MSKDFDELIRDMDLIIENVDSFKAMAPRAPEPAPPPPVHHYDSFCENIALKVVLKVLLSSVDKIVKVQIANKVEQEIALIEQQVMHAGGGPVSPDDLAQMTQYVRRTVSNLLE
ncbi:Uncharacterised protein [Serratia entomophila]|nr:Uncharacterised protein [Serratia entomophila]